MNFFRYNQKKVTIYCREKAGNGEGRILEIGFPPILNH
jgi:hypothetical protein